MRPPKLLTIAVAAIMFASCAGSQKAAAPTAKPDRTITVRMVDTLRYEPDKITVKAGETIRFDVVNAGKTSHEFYVATPAQQQEHEREMSAAATDMSHDGRMDMTSPKALSSLVVAPGKTASTTITFGSPDTIEFACHVPGHYQGGMRGSLIVT